MRGTLSHEAAHQPSVHLLSLSEVQTRMVLAQRAVDSKDNESSAAPDPLTALHIRGRIYTADAMHTHKKTCRCLTYNDGAYLLIAKNNQSGLPRDLELFFADPPADRSTWRSATTREKGHGRIEIRTPVASTDLNEYFARDWRGIAQVFRLERTVIEKGERRTSVVYGFPSLSPKQADPARLLALLRAHWAIENRLPWRRDVTLDEDHSQVRTRRAPQVLAVLNNALLALMDCLHVPNVPAQMRIFQACPLEALRLFLVTLVKL